MQTTFLDSLEHIITTIDGKMCAFIACDIGTEIMTVPNTSIEYLNANRLIYQVCKSVMRKIAAFIGISFTQWYKWIIYRISSLYRTATECCLKMSPDGSSSHASYHNVTRPLYNTMF